MVLLLGGGSLSTVIKQHFSIICPKWALRCRSGGFRAGLGLQIACVNKCGAFLVIFVQNVLYSSCMIIPNSSGLDWNVNVTGAPKGSKGRAIEIEEPVELMIGTELGIDSGASKKIQGDGRLD